MSSGARFHPQKLPGLGGCFDSDHLTGDFFGAFLVAGKKTHLLPGKSAGALFGLVKRPFERLSDLQPRDQKITLNHLVQGLKRSFFPWVSRAKSTT